MASITIGSVDLDATLGFNMTSDGEYLAGAMGVPGSVEIPGVGGGVFGSIDRTAMREFVVEGYLDGASRAAVRTNLHKLRSLVSAQTTFTYAGWSTVQLLVRCIDFQAFDYPHPNASTRANAVNEIPVAVRMTFRSANPFWQDITPQSVGFTTSPVAMPQGTAPSYPVLTTTAGAIAGPVITAKDHDAVTLWTATLEALLTGERYRITTEPGVMTLEKYNGSAWVNSDASLVAGIFPRPLPSEYAAYAASDWPTLEATTGTWTADYPRQWR